MIQPLLVYFMRTYSAYPRGVLRASLDAVTWVVPRLVYPHRRGRRQALYLQPGSDALLIPDLVRCAWLALWQPQHSVAAALPPATRQPQRHGPAPYGLTGFQVRGTSSSRSAINQPPGGLDDVAAEQHGRHVGVPGEPRGGQDERLHHGVGLDQPPQAARFGEIQCVLPDLGLDVLGGFHAVLRLSNFPISGLIAGLGFVVARILMCDGQRQTCGKACYRSERGIRKTCGRLRLSAEAQHQT